MKDKRARQEEERLVGVLMKDRLSASGETLAMLRSDLMHLLEDYFDLDADSLHVSLDAREEGGYLVRIAAKAVRMRS